MISLLLFQALELIQPEVKTAVILLWFLKLISPMGFLEWRISHVCRGRHIGLTGFFRPSGPHAGPVIMREVVIGIVEETL